MKKILAWIKEWWKNTPAKEKYCANCIFGSLSIDESRSKRTFTCKSKNITIKNPLLHTCERFE